jgi:hypothetical protein
VQAAACSRCFKIARVLVRLNHVASHFYHLYLLLADSW